MAAALIAISILALSGIAFAVRSSRQKRTVPFGSRRSRRRVFSVVPRGGVLRPQVSAGTSAARMLPPREIRAALDAAIAAQDPDAFEFAMTLAFESGLPSELSPILTEALRMPWHTRHEDLANALQEIKDPRSVAALFEAALSKHAYLAYDDSLPLARKCTWALADIGTPEARGRLEDLTRVASAEVAAYAQERLDNWEREASRKTPRAAG